MECRRDTRRDSASPASGVCGCVLNPVPEVRFVALGDSITGTLETDTYPRFLVRELDIDEADSGRARAHVEAMCEKLLANTVIETYTIDLDS